MASSQSLVQFLRAVAAARKGLRLYPRGSVGAGAAVARLREALARAASDGLTPHVRLVLDGFVQATGKVPVSDEVLSGLRRDLQARGIGEFRIEPEAEGEELVAFLDLLNLPPETMHSVADASAFLRSRGVTHITVGGLSASAVLEGDAAGLTGGGAGSSDEPGIASSGRSAAVEDLVMTILDSVEERLAALAYDREALTTWLEGIASTRGVGVVYDALHMLAKMAEGAGDSEVRTRTALEATLRLPEAILRPLLSDWLMPSAGADLTAFNLLAHMSEDDLAAVASVVPADQLMRFTAELLEFPWEQGKRQRLLEAMTWRLSLPRGAEHAPPGATPPLDETFLAELRGEILEGLNPTVLLERSADVLLALVADADIASQLGSAADALAEVVAEALTRDRLDLAAHVLEEVDRLGTSAGAVQTMRRKLGERAQVTQLVALLRQDLLPGRLDAVARYLRLAGPDSMRAFIDLQADESDRRVRLLMSDTLARVGPAAVPVLATRLGDPRWHVVRNALYTLRRIGPAAASAPIASAFVHPHPRVRREAIRTAIAVGGPVAADTLGALVADRDPDVRRAAISALGMPGNIAAIPILRQALRQPPREAGDEQVAREVMHALACIGTPEAVRVVREISERRTRFWARAERRLRDMAAEVLAGREPGGPEGGRR